MPPLRTLNESPSEKEGKSVANPGTAEQQITLNESPSEKEGKFLAGLDTMARYLPSMKVPPKRKGNQEITEYAA